MVTEGELLWQPDAKWIQRSHVTAFMSWLAKERNLRFSTYQALWQWSVTDLDAFWGAMWDYFKIQSSVPYERVLGSRKMPGAEWFPVPTHKPIVAAAPKMFGEMSIQSW